MRLADVGDGHLLAVDQEFFYGGAYFRRCRGSGEFVEGCRVQIEHDVRFVGVPLSYIHEPASVLFSHVEFSLDPGHEHAMRQRVFLTVVDRALLFSHFGLRKRIRSLVSTAKVASIRQDGFFFSVVARCRERLIFEEFSYEKFKKSPSARY
ncbi:MAG TPA: hypothetical protein VGM83_05735 [Devosiaceae bacterium]|jgi:hypothetical protein